MKADVIEYVRDRVAGTQPAARADGRDESKADREERLEGDERAELARWLFELHDQNEEQARFTLAVLTYLFPEVKG